MDNELNILILEDVPADAELMESQLRRGGIKFSAKRVETKKAFLRELKEFNPDLILADYKLPSFDGLSALEIVQEKSPDVPVIFVSGTIGEELAIDALKRGATDYVLKDRLFGLVPAVDRALREVKDRTERKKAEEALRNSEDKYRTILETIEEGYYEVDLAGNFTFLNDAMCRIWGYPKEELMGMNNRQYTDKEAAKRLFQAFNKVYKTGRISKVYDYEIIKKDGNRSYVETSISLRKDSAGKTIGFRGIIRDITERKQAENAIRESKQLLEKAFANLRDALLIIDAKTLKIIDCNPAASEIFGYKHGEMVGQTVNFLHVDDKTLEEFRSHLFAAIKKQGFLSRFEFKMKRKDGTIFPTEHNVTPIEDEQGNRILWVSIVRDITERKRAEKEHQDSEERYRRLVDNSLLGIGISCGNQIVFANPALLSLFGYDDIEEFTSVPLLNAVAPASREMIAARMQKVAQGKPVPAEFEYDILRKDGSIKTLLASSSRYTLDGKIYTQTTFQDITDRKLAEVQLRESQQRFQGLVETLNDWIWEVDKYGVYTYVSPRIKDLLGYEPKEVLGKTPFDLMPPEEAERVKAEFERLLTSQRPITALENTCLHKDGRSIVFETSGMPFFDAEGRVKGYRGVDRDITERKQAEQTLKERQETINAIIETSQDWIWAIDSQGVHTYSNPAIEKILGYRPEEIVGNTNLDLIHEDDRKMVQPIVQECREKNCGWNNLLLRWRHKNGTYRYLESNAVPILDSKGDVLGFRGVDRDITERKQDEQALQQKTAELSWLNQQLEFVLNATKAGIDIIDADFNLIYIDRQWQQIYGDPTGRKCYEYYMGREQPCPTCAIPKALETKQTVVSEEVLPRENNRIIEVHTIPFQESDGQWRVAEFNLDITDRKKLQETLDKERKELKLIIDASPIIVFYKDKEGRFIRVNRVFAEALKMKEQDLVGKTVFDIYSPQIAQDMSNDDREVLQSGKPKLNIIEQYESASGIRLVQSDKIPIFDKAGIPNGLIGFAQDITERRQAEEELRESEAQFRMLFEAIPDCVIVHDDRGVILHINEIGAQRLGWSAKDLAGRNLREIVTPENDALIADHIRSTLKEGWSRFETTYVSRSGWKIEAEVNDRLIKFGEKKAILRVSRDITERKRAREALAESEKKYRQVVENATDIIYTTDINGNFKYANSIALKVTGYSLDELQRFNYLDLVVTEYRDQLKEIYGNQFRSGQATTYVEFPFTNKFGEVMWFGQNASLIIEGGRIIGFQVMARDITARRHVEEALRESEEKYRDLVENINDILYATDEHGIITYIAPAIEAISGYSLSEIIGRAFFDFVHEEDVLCMKNGFRQDISGQPEPHEFRMLNKAGVVRWVRASSRPFFVKDRVAGLRGTLTDITARKKAEEEIKHSYEQLQETLRATVNALAATVEMKDQYTAGHQPRVTKLACAIAEEMGLSEDQIEGIRMAASIHDIGKIMVPAEILNKPGRLTKIQYEMIKIHPQAGYDILKGLKLPWPVAQIILQHHERMDGSGYPHGLLREEIIVEARILAVANVVEAMNAHRPYRPAHDIKDALTEISRNRGTLYDAMVVDACVRLFSEKGFTLDPAPQ